MSFLQPCQMQDIKYIRTCVLLLIVYLHYRHLNLATYLLYSLPRIVGIYLPHKHIIVIVYQCYMRLKIRIYPCYRHLRIALAFQQSLINYLQIYTCINYYQQPYYKFYSQTHLGKLGRRLTNYLVRFVVINSNQHNRGSRNSLHVEQTAIVLCGYYRY